MCPSAYVHGGEEQLPEAYEWRHAGYEGCGLCDGCLKPVPSGSWVGEPGLRPLPAYDR